MRVILYTGKGGVGKTSTAAATALRCAQMGQRTIVLSTDLAHSLADAFDAKLGPEPQQLAPNLWAQEVDVYHEIRRHWANVQEYLYKMLTWRGLDDVVAEEMTVFPGMEELSSLLLILRYQEEGSYDVCIVDCAPTGETLRLLSFPEGARWWLKGVLPLQRKISQVIRPLARHLTDMPFPDEAVLDSINDFMDRLERMRKVLSDPTQSSVRLVLTPERMVIKEAQRTYTYLNLYNYNVDAVVCNRMLPETVTDSYFDAWRERQAEHFKLVEECFAPLPILQTPLFAEEVVGSAMLEKLAASAFADSDPAAILHQGRTHDISKEGDRFILSIPLPLASKPEIEMFRTGEELVIRIGSQRRNILLPRTLAGLETREAKFVDGVLRVSFS